MRVGFLGGGDLLRALQIPYEERAVTTRFGDPSDRLRVGAYRGMEIITLLRHGRRHEIPAHRVNFRANIAALAQMGPEVIFGISTCGCLSGVESQGALAIYDQILDFTHGRSPSLFEEHDAVHHVSVAEPVCPVRAHWTQGILSRGGVRVVHGGTLAVIQGPRFATTAESRMLRQLGADFVNMSAAPEVFLAREAGLCYVPLSLITDSDNSGGEVVTLKSITASIFRFRDVVPRAATALFEEIAQGKFPPCTRCKPGDSAVEVGDLNL